MLSSSVVDSITASWFVSPIPCGFLSGNAVTSASVAFSPDGQFLIVTEKATNNLDVFTVLSDGSLSQATITKSVGPGAFSDRQMVVVDFRRTPTESGLALLCD